MSADDMLLEPPTPVRLGDVARQDRTAEWVTYHRLVVDEAHGNAPAGTDRLLALDPYRWAAHLGCAAGELTEQLRSAPDGPAAWRRAVAHARRTVTARKGDVVAIRKRDILARAARTAHERTGVLVAEMAEVLEALAGGDVDRAQGIAAAAVARSTDGREAPPVSAVPAPAGAACSPAGASPDDDERTPLDVLVLGGDPS